MCCDIHLLLSASILGISLFVSACERTVETDQAPAVVYDEVLTEQEVWDNIPSGISQADSILLYNTFVERWVRRQLYLNEAEKVVSKSISVDELVENYRQSLLIHHYEDHVSSALIDTAISEQEILRYYDDNKDYFELRQDVLQLLQVHIPPLELDIFMKLKAALSDPASTTNVRDLATKDSLQITEEWITESKLAELLQNENTGTTEDSILMSQNVFITEQQNSQIVNKIVGKKSKGNVAPIDFVREEIEDLIYHQRKQEILSKIKDELYHSALEDGGVQIIYKE